MVKRNKYFFGSCCFAGKIKLPSGCEIEIKWSGSPSATLAAKTCFVASLCFVNTYGSNSVSGQLNHPICSLPSPMFNLCFSSLLLVSARRPSPAGDGVDGGEPQQHVHQRVVGPASLRPAERHHSGVQGWDGAPTQENLSWLTPCCDAAQP